MSGKYFLIGIITLGLIAGGVWFVSQRQVSPPASPNLGGPVEGEVTASFEEYIPQTLEQYKGKPVVANTWAMWCPFCVEELKEFAAVQREFGDEIVILAINRQESPSAQQEYLAELGVLDDLVFLLDPSDSFYRNKLNGFSMPETLFIDREGNTQFHKRGPMDEAEIRERLELIL